MKLGDLSTNDVFSVKPQDPVHAAIKIMEQHGVHHIPVLAGRQVVGIVSDRDILIGWGAAETEAESSSEQGFDLGLVEDIMSKPVFTLSPDDALRSATWLMVRRRVHAIPLVHHDHLVGIVTESDLLRGVMASREFTHQSFLQQPVANFVRGRVMTVRATTSLSDVVDIMRQERIRHLPVVIGDELLGIVSDRDVRRALGNSALRDAQAQEHGEFYLGPSEVEQVMTKDVRSIPSSATAEQAIDLLLQHRIHSLPIVDVGKVVGIITDTDLLRAIGARDKEAAGG